MTEKVYIVLEGKKYTGKHAVYNAGDKFLESELSGNEDNLDMAINGNKSFKVDPVIKLAAAEKKVTK